MNQEYIERIQKQLEIITSFIEDPENDDKCNEATDAVRAIFRETTLVFIDWTSGSLDAAYEILMLIGGVFKDIG